MEITLTENQRKTIKRVLFVIITCFFGLVIYRYGKKTGFSAVFFRGLELLVPIYVFFILHCFLNIRNMYNQIFQKRVWITLILIAFFTVNKFSFSSIQMWNSYIQPDKGSVYTSNIYGAARAIRTDDWMVTVPRVLSGSYDNYDEVNTVTRGTETDMLAASGMKRGFSALAEPAEWGYYLFGPERGIAFEWSFRMFLGFLFSFELCLILTRGNRKLALLGGTLIWFSGYNMWWSTVMWLVAGQAALVFFHYFLEEDNRWKRLLWGLGIAIAGANYVVMLYPAWQVPMGYVCLCLLIWIFAEHREKWQKYRIADWLLAILCVVFMIGLVGVYLYRDMEYITAISNTVYPGARVEPGGFMLTKLLQYFDVSTACFVDRGNVCELGTFYSLFPFSLILFLYVMARKRGKSLLMWMIAVPSLLIGSYCTVVWPMFLAKVTLMGHSMPTRAVDIFSYLNILMLVVSLDELGRRDEWKMNKLVALVLAAACSGLIYAYSHSGGTKKGFVAILCLFLGTMFVEYVFGAVAKKGWVNLALLGLTLVVFCTGIQVNPILYGTEVITSKPVAKKVTALLEENPESKWLSLDNFFTGNYLIALGASTYNSTNYIPNMELWEKLDPKGRYEEVYNRYAHMVVSLVDEETRVELLAPDSIWAYISYEDLEKMNVDYILTEHELASRDDITFKEIYDEYGERIYKVEYK